MYKEGHFKLRSYKIEAVQRPSDNDMYVVVVLPL